MRFPVSLAALAVLWPLSQGAVAECQCLCMDGQAKTLCSSVGEARSNVDLCGPQVPGRCPVNLQAPAAESYPAPAEGAVNCRDVELFDPATRAHLGFKACDVLPEGGASD